MSEEEAWLYYLIVLVVISQSAVLFEEFQTNLPRKGAVRKQDQVIKARDEIHRPGSESKIDNTLALNLET